MKVGINGEIQADGSVALDVFLDIGASAELDFFIGELKGSLEIGGSYGLRFSREQAVEFSRLVNDLVNTLGTDGISFKAENARDRLVAFMRANERKEIRVTAAGSAAAGSGNDKYGLGAKVVVSRIVQNRSVDSNGNNEFDSSDKVVQQTTYQAALTVDVTVEGRKYSGMIVGAYDADTGRIKRPTLTVEAQGQQIPDSVLEEMLAQGRAQGVLAKGQGVSKQALTEVKAEATEAASGSQIVSAGTKSVTRLSVDFEAGSLSYTNGSRREVERKVNLFSGEGKISSYDEKGTTVKVAL